MKLSFLLAAALLLFCSAFAGAQPLCTDINGSSFTGTSPIRKLKADCRTSVTIVVPTGMTLNGQGFTITAFDPNASGFKGAVVRAAAGGEDVTVTNLIVDTEELLPVCDGGDDRLRGILFDNASGKITNTTVLHINQGGGDCSEGNAIEVRNFTESSPLRTVTVNNNLVYAYQKTGIIINGNVDGTVANNIVGQSATQDSIAANGIQVGFGAVADVKNNDVEGNTWLGFNPDTANFAATAVLLFEAAAGSKVSGNRINLVSGNADVGIYVIADSVTVTDNRVYDWGPDTDGPDQDTGISNPGNLNGGIDNTFTKNKVRCYQKPYDNISGPTNTILPCTDSSSTMLMMLRTAAAASAPAAAASPSR